MAIHEIPYGRCGVLVRKRRATMRILGSLRTPATVLALMVWAAFPGAATVLTVLNPSFETPTFGPGGFAFGVTDWSSTGGGGAFRPNVGTEVNSVPDGSQVAFIFGTGNLFQDL